MRYMNLVYLVLMELIQIMCSLIYCLGFVICQDTVEVEGNSKFFVVNIVNDFRIKNLSCWITCHYRLLNIGFIGRQEKTNIECRNKFVWCTTLQEHCSRHS
ncbi:hypothetical protein YM18_0048 [Geobacter sulfurreducens]|nr:hypothetical protein YM18_0048 [Geobacter sulfurreducens]